MLLSKTRTERCFQGQIITVLIQNNSPQGPVIIYNLLYDMVLNFAQSFCFWRALNFNREN